MLNENSSLFFNDFSLGIRYNIFKVLTQNYDIFKTAEMGRYHKLKGTLSNTEKAHNTIKNLYDLPIYTKENFNASVSLQYLRKSIDYCKKKKIPIYLIRLPVHKELKLLENEKHFKDIRKAGFSDVEFLDFLRFPIDNSEFADLVHLNNKGAEKFSKWFNYLLEQGLLSMDNKQAFIDKQIATYNE